MIADEPVRKHIARILKISPQNTYGLLEQLGGDCAGAIRLQTVLLTLFCRASIICNDLFHGRVLKNNNKRGFVDVYPVFS